MTCVNVTSVNVLDNPSRFVNPFQFEISFECIAHITDDIEWKLTYVGSAESDQHDQELDSVLVGPMQVGGYKIVFQADPPDPTRIPPQDLLGVTVVLLSCFYKDREFIRVGYYVNNEYDTPELNEEPPQQPLYDRLVRNILADKPRVTRYNISWDDAPQVEGMSIEGGIPATPPGAPPMDPTQAAHAAGLAAQAAGAGAEEAEAAAQAAGQQALAAQQAHAFAEAQAQAQAQAAAAAAAQAAAQAPPPAMMMEGAAAPAQQPMMGAAPFAAPMVS